jgi:predicted lysophospholipase L1 biosynthesis ABC-type transport system permease subunit
LELAGEVDFALDLALEELVDQIQFLIRQLQQAVEVVAVEGIQVTLVAFALEQMVAPAEEQQQVIVRGLAEQETLQRKVHRKEIMVAIMQQLVELEPAEAVGQAVLDLMEEHFPEEMVDLDLHQIYLVLA